MQWVIGSCHSVQYRVLRRAALETCLMLFSLLTTLMTCCSAWSMRGNHFKWRPTTSLYFTINVECYYFRIAFSALTLLAMIGRRNVWSMKWRVPGQEVDQRKLGERLWKKTVRHVYWTGRMPWIVLADKGQLMTTIGVSGWVFLLVPAHPGCSGQNPRGP